MYRGFLYGEESEVMARRQVFMTGKVKEKSEP